MFQERSLKNGYELQNTDFFPYKERRGHLFCPPCLLEFGKSVEFEAQLFQNSMTFLTQMLLAFGQMPQ